VTSHPQYLIFVAFIVPIEAWFDHVHSIGKSEARGNERASEE
jgi:hypothetical protein